MATYNWKYKSGSLLPTGERVAVSEDDVKPSNCCYIALFGNHDTGNGSRIRPYRSIQKSSGFTAIVASGRYREYIRNAVILIGDGDVLIDGFITSQGNTLFETTIWGLYDVKLVGGELMLTNGGGSQVHQVNNCVFDDVSPTSDGRVGYSDSGLKNCLTISRSDISKRIRTDVVSKLVNVNSTFVNHLLIYYGTEIGNSASNYACIFFNCQFEFQGDRIPNNFSFSIFYQCSFKFKNENDFKFYNDIEELRNAAVLIYGSYSYFPSCLITDPKFNNSAINDYSLSFDSPAKNLSYFGTYVGYQSIAYSIKARKFGGDFDLSTNNNFIIDDNSIVLANPALEGSIESNVIPNLIARELATAPVYGSFADRNGQYLDATEDLSTATISVDTQLRSNTPYLVENAAITYNGAVIQPGERFTTTSVLSFASAGNGVCREILEAPQRHTILARFSDGDTVLSSGTALAVGHWYYANGTVNYEGVAYTDQVFKANTANPFTGNGNVTLAMGNETYQHYEPGIKLTSNNAGDVRTGAIIRGNGDPLYERGIEKEFPINARFIQFKYIIKVNNLKP